MSEKLPNKPVLFKTLSVKIFSFKLFLLILALGCLNHAYAAKLPKTKTNGTAVDAEATKMQENTAVAATATKGSTNNEDSTDEDDDDDDDDDDVEEQLKNALKPADDTSLSVWGIVRGIWDWIKDDISESLFGDDTASAAASVGEGRTFGKIRRLQMALIPIIFKFGVLTAMVAFLVAVSLKTLFFVKMLFLINVVALLGKFFTLKTNFFGHAGHIVSAPPSAWGWNPHTKSDWSYSAAGAGAGDAAPSKEIHLHIHGANGEQPQVSSYSYGSGAGQSNAWQRRNDPYAAYEPSAQSQNANNEISNEFSSPATSVSESNSNNNQYVSNHRMF